MHDVRAKIDALLNKLTEDPKKLEKLLALIGTDKERQLFIVQPTEVYVMTTEVSEIQKEIERTRERLRSLEHKLQKSRVGHINDEERIRQVEAELRAQYPDARPDRQLLSLVGILPAPRVSYKQAVRRVVAERYGR
ncbi:MAG: hypothetical protein HY619_04195 [Thaumarchaeota archaeon]|nr:hypothetical protein [Nitrososphaerota archaeon]